MSKNVVELVLGKTLLEAEFRAALLADPEKTLVEYKLTKAEIAFLLHLDGETLEVLASFLNNEKNGKV